MAASGRLELCSACAWVHAQGIAFVCGEGSTEQSRVMTMAWSARARSWVEGPKAGARPGCYSAAERSNATGSKTRLAAAGWAWPVERHRQLVRHAHAQMLGKPSPQRGGCMRTTLLRGRTAVALKQRVRRRQLSGGGTRACGSPAFQGCDDGETTVRWTKGGAVQCS
jgi:hypothetical protein